VVVIDLDGDGREQSGWAVVLLHVATNGRAQVGTSVETGDAIGFPSCEGGRSTGTHVHIARKFNGEWIAADGPIPFNLSGWIAHSAGREYKGTLTKGEDTVTACECSSDVSGISVDR
jgi:LasA protease